MSWSAELVDDRGAASAAPEFFRAPEFLGPEGVTHSLRISNRGEEIVAPLVVREVPGSEQVDAVSPYGYPGFGGTATGIDPADVDWRATGLVSLFLRHRLDTEPPLAGTSARNTVQIADPALPRKSRPSDRQQIRRNAERGYAVRRVAGEGVSDADLEGFHTAYEQTMVRAEAAQRYFFDREYFASILRFGGSALFLAVEPGGEIAAGSVVARSDSMLHYYLSGTADPFLSDSPMKNLVSAIVDFAEEAGMPLNLGGGLAPGDPLEEFKRGFANRSEPFRTSEVVCDAPAYERLSAGREAGDYFPAYRA